MNSKSEVDEYLKKCSLILKTDLNDQIQLEQCI